MKKRILSIILVLAMCLTLMPTMVWATETHEHSSITFTEWRETDSLPTAAGNYYLTDNVTLDKTWSVPTGDPVNLCLNGYVIKANCTEDNKFGVITVPTGATLNLYDCDTTTHNGYVDGDGLWHLGTGEGTAKSVTGGVITGGNATNGGGVNVSGTFNMYGGNIVGNAATDNGGGVSNAGTFTMTGGTITGNTATNGGGVYTTSLLGVNILVGGTITGNTANAGGGLYYKEEMCFVAGTPITMADGSRKPIETLEIGDLVRVFDHESGTISTAKLFDLWKYPEKHSGVVTLHFSHDIDVTVVYGHSFFEREANKYISISRDNVKSYVGHEFYNVDDARWETLIGYDFLDGEVDTYVITSEKYLNSVANGMLNNEDGLYTLITNVFEFGDCLKIDAEKKASDIKKYGLWSFDNTRCISKNTYDMLNFQYLSVAFGKGMITPEEFAYLESFWTEVDPELLGKTEKEKEESKPTLRKMLLGASPLETPVPAPTTAGIYVGGSLKITGNDSGNLCISSGTAITIGTGTGSGGNGVVAPTETLEVGVTMQTPGRFTTNGTTDDTNYFTPDDTAYEVKFNNNATEATTDDDYLELAVKAYTIADILPDGFPAYSGGIPINAWENSTGSKLFINNDGLNFGGTCLNNILTASVTKNENNYQYTSSPYTITFVMDSDKLVKVIIAGCGTENYNGDYIPAPHTHSFTYVASDNKLTATCTQGCDKGYDTTPLTLTLTAPTSLVYDGNAKAFTFADGEADAWRGAGMELPTITYYQEYNNQGWYTQLNEVPVNAGGDYKAEIVVNKKAAQVKFTIDKATPYIKTTPAPKDIEYGKKLSDSTFAGGSVQVSSTNTTQVAGLFEWTNPDTVPDLDDSEVTEYDVTFTPIDTNNFNTVSCKVKIEVNHTHAPVLVNGQAATEGASGWKDYYECACGALFEDENGTTPIENLATWKAQGGNGYIAPLPTHSSGGGSTPTVTVPVTGDENSVKVSASVSGSTATVKEIKDADLAKVTGGESVEIDLTGLKKDVDTAKIPTATVEKIGEQSGMSVKLTTATVSFDKTATQEISDQAKGNTVELVVDDIKEVSLNAVQKEAVQKLDTALIIDAYLVSGGTKLCTEGNGGFNGGKATVMLPYEIKNNRSASNYNVYYVDDAGKLEKLAAKYDTKLGAFVFDIEHFSNYVVAYDENACPQDETCVYAKFTDADTKAWYHDGVHFCVENGYMQGVSDTKFAPSGTLSRGMIVTMLWRMEGEPVVNYAMSFKDVPSGQWYTEAIRWAQSTGVVDGYSADAFGPSDDVTREQLTAILYNYAKLKGQGFTGSWMFLLDFVDRADISSWADEAVHWCSMKGIVNGKDGKVFDPQGNATRAEAASMVQRFCEATSTEE